MLKAADGRIQPSTFEAQTQHTFVTRSVSVILLLPLQPAADCYIHPNHMHSAP